MHQEHAKRSRKGRAERQYESYQEHDPAPYTTQ